MKILVVVLVLLLMAVVAARALRARRIPSGTRDQNALEGPNRKKGDDEGARAPVVSGTDGPGHKAQGQQSVDHDGTSGGADGGMGDGGGGD